MMLRIIGLLCALAVLPGWAIGSQVNETGCHEPITAQALRDVRAMMPTAPEITPTRDEAALIADVMFAPPTDMTGDLASMALLLGVRDNDLKGIDPLSSLDLVQVHGNPTTQDEHCIRGPDDDGATGDQSALDACRAFIRDTATAALDGLDATGAVDANARMPLGMYLSLRGHATPMLPVFYVKMGAAMHALEDGFTHTYRSGDGMNVTVVLNWIDLVDGVGYDPARDGPEHRAELDHCWHADPLIMRNYQLATQAATELLAAALDPSATRDDKIARFDAVTAKYLTYQPGCTADNNWCDAPEAKVTETGLYGCNAAGGGSAWLVAVIIAAALGLRRRAAGVFVLLLASASAAHADDPPKPAEPATPIAATEPTAPALPPPADRPADAAQKEPGRDVKTPTVAEVQAVRHDKELGSPFGFALSIGGAIDRAAAVGSIGARYRVNERWLVGLDVEWNPWITTSPLKERAGVLTESATVIRRFPMKIDRVNLRSSLHVGVSTLLFDVYGAPKYSTGPYFALCPLGIDYDFGRSLRLVIDPVEFALPVPLLGQLPLYYEQFRFMVGLQIGS
jgi:uncharacterized protein (TIGR03382 family)